MTDISSSAAAAVSRPSAPPQQELMPSDQRAAGHSVLSHGAPLSGLAAHAPHGHVAMAAQGGDGNDKQHLHQQFKRISDLMRAAHTLLGDIAGVPLPDLRPSQQRQQRRPSQYVYQDAHTQAIVMCTWAAARQAMIRVRYFLDGDAGAMDPAGGGWRPIKRQAHDRGLAQECRPVRRGCGTAPLGLTPASCVWRPKRTETSGRVPATTRSTVPRK